MSTQPPKPKKNTFKDTITILFIGLVVRLFNFIWMALLLIIYLVFFIPMMIKPSLIVKHRDLLDKGVL